MHTATGVPYECFRRIPPHDRYRRCADTISEPVRTPTRIRVSPAKASKAEPPADPARAKEHEAKPHVEPNRAMSGQAGRGHAGPVAAGRMPSPSPLELPIIHVSRAMPVRAESAGADAARPVVAGRMPIPSPLRLPITREGRATPIRAKPAAADVCLVPPRDRKSPTG